MEVAEKLVQAISLYSKAASPSDGETNFPILASLYSRAVLRHSISLYAIWSAKGWGLHAFTQMLRPGLASPIEPGADKTSSEAALERLTSITGIARSSIAAVLSQAHGPWLLHLESRERIFVLETMATMYGALGYRRKEAYLLREVLGCIMDLVVCAREEAGGARVIGAGLGIQGVVNMGPNRGTVGIRENDSQVGNESVVRIVSYICKVHGVDLESVKIIDQTVQPKAEAEGDADDTEVLGVSHEPFGWPELQIGIVREAIAVAEALPGRLSQKPLIYKAHSVQIILPWRNFPCLLYGHSIL